MQIEKFKYNFEEVEKLTGFSQEDIKTINKEFTNKYKGQFYGPYQITEVKLLRLIKINNDKEASRLAIIVNTVPESKKKSKQKATADKKKQKVIVYEATENKLKAIASDTPGDASKARFSNSCLIAEKILEVLVESEMLADQWNEIDQIVRKSIDSVWEQAEKIKWNRNQKSFVDMDITIRDFGETGEDINQFDQMAI